MEYIQNVLAKLAWALGISGLAAGVLATVVALRVSRAALRPLRETATVIGSIDEAHLDRRIRTAALPAELVPMAQRLNGMLERLEQSFTQRKQFLADASHELRTPIAALLTTIEVAVRRKSSEEALRDTLKSCLGDARLLRELVEALMQQARSETLASHEPFAAIDVGEILREAVRLAQAEAQVKRVQVICKPGPVVVIETQVNRVRSIIRNILNNAVQHNRTAGTVEVASTVQDGELNIYVKDSGGGIRPEHLPHLFEPFYRADKARSEDGAHLGLGLFLVQTHLKALGGRCHVQSEPGVGTVFRVRIPLRKPAEAELSAIPQSPQTELAQGGAP